MPNERRRQEDVSDHDLLITLNEQVKAIREDIRMMQIGTATQITDHEARLRRLEWAGAVAVGLSFALQFYFNYLRP